MRKYVMAIDQGTTSTRTLLFDGDMRAVAMGQQEFPQHFPHPGWVEHDPEDILDGVVATARSAIAQAGCDASDIAAIGLTNQRETVVVWDRETGRAIHPAIVWQDRRTSDTCNLLKGRGCEADVAARTGLVLDPYFSATKIAWILDHVDGARSAADAGRLAFGTIDTFLLWRLTGGAIYKTDATNASRTLLYDLEAGAWSSDLCAMFDVPMDLLPDVNDCAALFGETLPAVFGAAIPITGVAGDQQAAAIGQACFEPGMVKATYGTGCFALLNTGSTLVRSTNRLLTTVAYQFDGRTSFALEGSIFVAGAAVQWLRDGLGVIDTAADCDRLAATGDDARDVVLVPAFVGLGAPHWDADCRGSLFGLTRDTGPADLARAVLESVCFQTHDLLEAMRRDWDGADGTVLRADGGMVVSDWMMQRLADVLDAPVDRPELRETTAVGAAYLAGATLDIYSSPEAFARQWSCERRFSPSMAEATRARKLATWQDAVQRTLSA